MTRKKLPRIIDVVNKGLGIKNSPARKTTRKPKEKIIRWSFDLTQFGENPRKWKNIMKRHGLKGGKRVCETKHGYKSCAFVWKNKGLKVVTGNNPITGKYYSEVMPRPVEKGYASYIGVRGKRSKVIKFANDVRKRATFIKEENPFENAYIWMRG